MLIRWFRERLHLRDSRHLRPVVRRLHHDEVSQSSRAVDRPREPSPRRFHARGLAIRRRVFGKHTEDVIRAGAHELHLELGESHARDGFRQRQRGVVHVASYGERVRSRRVRARRANHQRACDRQRARAREATTSHRARRGMQLECHLGLLLTPAPANYGLRITTTTRRRRRDAFARYCIVVVLHRRITFTRASIHSFIAPFHPIIRLLAALTLASPSPSPSPPLSTRSARFASPTKTSALPRGRCS